jgi:hypothetical protein
MVLAVVGLAVLFSGRAHSEKAKAIETFTSFGVNMQRGGSSTITIAIERWSTDEERDMFRATLLEKGQDGLIAALFKSPPVGYIRLPNTRGYDLKFARSTTLPDGTRRVVVATDRALQFREVVGSTRSQNYDFSVAEIRFPAGGGKGEGKLVPAALIEVDKETNQLSIESFNSQPTRLMSVTSKTD